MSVVPRFSTGSGNGMAKRTGCFAVTMYRPIQRMATESVVVT